MSEIVRINTGDDPGVREAVVLDFEWDSPSAKTAIFLFLLDVDGKFPSVSHLVKPEAESAHGGFVRLSENSVLGASRAQAQFHLASAGSEVKQVLVLLSVVEPGATLADIATINVTVWNPETNEVDDKFATPAFGVSKCAILAELLRKEDEWILSHAFEPRQEALHQLANKIGVSS